MTEAQSFLLIFGFFGSIITVFFGLVIFMMLKVLQTSKDKTND